MSIYKIFRKMYNNTRRTPVRLSKGGDDVTNTNLLKARMVEHGDSDCVAKLAELLSVSRVTASGKLNGKISFNQKEISLIAEKYDLSDEDIRKIFVKDG